MEHVQHRFDELAIAADAIASSLGTTTRQVPQVTSWGTGEVLRTRSKTDQLMDGEKWIQWQTSAQALLERVFGTASSTYRNFEKEVQVRSADYHAKFRKQRSIFLSAKDQYEGGHLFDLKNLVHAEVFADELEQAAHFLVLGYRVPAAVIAGTVLESTLRELCRQHPALQAEKTNRMNDDLAKEGVYNAIQADQVRAWAKIRNSAAHGKPDEFEEGDVKRMIEGIRDFVARHMQ